MELELDPFFDLQRQMTRFFEPRSQFQLAPSSSSSWVGEWRPTADVYETDKELVYHAELPGISKDNVKVEIVGNSLHITGERMEEKDEKTRRAHIRERSFGKFVRMMPLPQGAQEKDISADFKNGLLEVRVKKPASQKKESSRKQIEIKSQPA